MQTWLHFSTELISIGIQMSTNQVEILRKIELVLMPILKSLCGGKLPIRPISVSFNSLISLLTINLLTLFLTAAMLPLVSSFFCILNKTIFVIIFNSFQLKMRHICLC